MNILIAIDTSEGSRCVVDEALARPWPHATQFRIVNSIDPTIFAELPALIEDATREGEQLVVKAAEKLRGAGLTVDTEILSGTPRDAISACARKWGADLILIGSHGHGAIGRFLLGSVAQGVLRKANCSVEIVRSAESRSPSSRAMNVLVATDGSECSLEAARSVSARPWPAATRFRVLSVEELVNVATSNAMYASPVYYPPSLLEELFEIAHERARSATDAATAILTRAGLQVVAPNHAPAGDPRSMILDTAETWHADLIVLGSHGRRGFDRLLLGSVSEAVALHARCSVEIIRSSRIPQGEHHVSN